MMNVSNRRRVAFNLRKIVRLFIHHRFQCGGTLYEAPLLPPSLSLSFSNQLTVGCVDSLSFSLFLTNYSLACNYVFPCDAFEVEQSMLRDSSAYLSAPSAHYITICPCPSELEYYRLFLLCPRGRSLSLCILTSGRRHSISLSLC